MRLRRTGLWKNHDFLNLWASESVSQVGSQITLVALPLLAALSLDASAAQMGILTAAGTAPPLLLGRVNATMRFLNAGMIPVGALIGGALGGLIGLRETLFAGVAGMLMTGLWVYLSPLRTTRDTPALLDEDSDQLHDVAPETGTSTLPT